MEWCWNGAARRIRRSMFLAGGNIASVSLCHLTSVCALSTKERTVCAILRIKLVTRCHYYHVKLSYIFLSSNLKLILRWTKYYLFWPLLSLRWSIVYSELWWPLPTLCWPMMTLHTFPCLNQPHLPVVEEVVVEKWVNQILCELF